MFNFWQMTADIPGPFPYVEPTPDNQNGLLMYALAALLIVGAITSLAVLFYQPHKTNKIDTADKKKKSAKK